MPTKIKYYQLQVDEAKREASVMIFGDITSWEIMDNDVSSYTLAKEIEGLDVDTTMCTLTPMAER